MAALIGVSVALGCAGPKAPDESTSDTMAPVESAEATFPDDTYPVTELVSRADEECCTDPGSIAACWWQDADRDGATCLSDADCGASSSCNKDVRYGEDNKIPPNRWGLCSCSSDSDCQGDGRDGICAEINGEKVCAPSYCNGYLVCSCFGGCAEGKASQYDTPAEMCESEDDGFPGECCEGNYPADPDGEGVGFCSDSCDGTYAGADCNTDADCIEPIPEPYSTDCAQMVCDDGTCRVDYINAADSCSDRVAYDESYWGEAVRDAGAGTLSCFVGFCSTSGRCVASTPEADGLACDEDDGNPCTDEICAAGICTHDFEDNIGELCNADGDACTLDECDGTGTCLLGTAKNCDDGNWCTGEDVCEDNDPDHIAATCVNPPLDGNADGFGYSDTTDCSDLMCVGGVEVPTATDCTGYNPNGYNLQCNEYNCVDGNGEDNCTLSYTHEIGNPCSDGDACTVGDRCVDGTDHGACEPLGNMDCDDLNPCTTDTCSGGVCSSSPDTGDPCDDGNPCTLNDTCDATGACVPGSPKDCSGLDNECTNGVCNVANGNCEPSYLASGASCDADGNPCTVGDTCDGAGTCNPGADKNCDSEDDACNDGVCNTGTGLCEKSPVADGTACEADGDACTPDDICQAGVCTVDATPVSCAAFNDACNVSVCNSTTGTCEYTNAGRVGLACNLDNNGCTAETCQGSAVGDTQLDCLASGTVDCADGNQCTDDICTSTGDYTHTCTNPDLASGTACNADSNGCTADDQCDGSGGCTPGTNVDALMCEAELDASNPLFDPDCSSATCVSTGDNAHDCVPAVRVTNPGDCNADFDACTLDVCGPFDATNGATCTAGAARNCVGLDVLPCQSGVCDDSGDFYNSICAASYAASGTSCDADGDGCTAGDICDGAGVCDAGAAVACSPSDTCHTAACTSTGTDSYTCDETLIAGCCEVADDCIGQGYPCEGGDSCNELVCNAGVCDCNTLAEGDSCDDLVLAAYPENCYAGACNASGDCAAGQAVLSDVPNNLCSDLFDTGNSGQFMSGNAGNLGDLGPSAVDGEMLSATGSTLCGFNNYRASAANNCMEKADGADLGINGNDVVYSFRYWTPASADHELYSYVVKVESDFDVGLYIQDGISDADECPEGNNPGDDESSNAVVRGEGYISYEIWTGYSGTAITGHPPTTAADYIGWYDELRGITNFADNYVQRIRGYLTAPTTGTYTFWISGDDNCALYLSPDTVSDNKVEIASVPGYTAVLQWGKYSNQKSAGVDLVAGEKYYIEVLHKEGSVGDNVAVGWAKPGQSTATPSEVVPGAQLSPWDGNDTPSGEGSISWERWQGLSGSDLVSTIPVTTPPAASGTYTSFEAPVNYMDSFGTRVRGYLTAPYTGDYTFFVTANNDGELWISPDIDPANKVRIVSTNADAAPNNWTANPNQKSAPVSLVRGERYYIEGLYRENLYSDNFQVGWAKPGESTATASEVIPGAYLSPWDGGPQSGYGYVSYEKWTGLSGTAISDIPVGTTPDETGIYLSVPAWPSDVGNNYGQRIYGYIMPPLTGSYIFWVAADDTAELWLSTDDVPANKVRIANVPAWTNYNEWSKYAQQKSVAVDLVAGEYYYFEILHNEGTGGDHVEIAWTFPGDSTSAPSEVIEEHQLAPWGLDDYEDITDPTGNVCFDMWFGSYANLTEAPTSRTPDVSGAYDDLEGLRNWAGYPFFYQRIRGYIVPPTTGNYTFWLTSDDDGELWLSTNENPVNKTMIASCPVAWFPDNWLAFASQKSASIPMVAGNRYYVEVYHTDWYGRDHIQVGWSKPGESTASGPSEVIPGAYLDPLDGGCGNASVDVGWVCQNPYTDMPMPAVVEEECSELGNTLNGQTCCDPCDASCYNVCERGYRTSDDALCDLCDADCEATWEVSEAPFSCTPEKPADASYNAFSEMALAVIQPKPVDGGAWRNAVVYVDGSAGESGNFYISVEKRKQPGSVCERVDDSPRIIDVTDATAAGITYSSSIENLANSRHVTAGDTSCGGYDCTPEWVADGTCHSSSDLPNAFWPAWEGFLVSREIGDGSQTYCVTAAPAASDGLDPVVTVMALGGSGNTCHDTATFVDCDHAGYLSTQSRVQFTATAGTDYLIEVSRYEGLSRPCLNSLGDDCDYTLTVQKGTCP